MTDKTVNLDDIDLDLEMEDELKKVLAIDEEPKEVVSQEEDPAEEEEVPSEEEVPVEPKDDEVKRELAELKSERQRLQDQLNELSVTTLTDRRRMIELEKSLRETKAREPDEPVKPRDEGPTPEQVIGQLDKRIAQVDAALAKAESQDPASVPELRRQLRTLERYYNNYLTQVQLQIQQGERVDPELVVQQAVVEAQQQNRFNSIKGTILDQFPVLDPNSEYFDESLRDEVHAVYNPMIKAGADPADALAKTVSLVTAARGIAPLSKLQEMYYQQQQAEAEAAKKAEEAAAKKSAGTTRKQDQIKKNLEAAAAQPPNIATVGQTNDSKGILDKYDFGGMGINEFMRIPDEELDKIESVLALYD